MGAYKKLNQQDTYISTYTARKSWTASGSQYTDLGILNLVGESGSGAYIPLDSNIVYGGGSLNASTVSFDKRLIYQSIYQLYYSSFSGSVYHSTSSFDNYLQSSFNVSGSRHLNENIAVFSLPKEVYGTHIEPSSISMSLDVPPGSERNYVLNNYVTSGGIDSDLDLYNQYTIPAITTLPSSSTSIIDDGEGNLYLSSGSNVLLDKIGNVIYPHGQIIITDTPLAKVFNNELNAVIRWKSNLPIYTQNYHCRVKANDLNFTLNKTAVNQETGQIKDNISGSDFQPYVSTIGLYNDANQLIAVAKTASPVPKSTNTDMSFYIKLDMNFGVNRFPTPVSRHNFNTTWQTTSPNESIIFPIGSNLATANMTVDWGDGTEPEIYVDEYPNHTYITAGTYNVSISGIYDYIDFDAETDNSENIISIDQWGTNQWNSFNYAFYDCINLQGNATDTPDLSNVTDMSNMFSGASSFNQNINNWDVSNVTDMARMFRDASAFNQPIGDWNVSNVTEMNDMFNSATTFNQDITSWDVSNVDDIRYMFDGATSFNQPIGNWDVSNVTRMNGMFADATAFNKDLSGWSVANVTNCTSFSTGATAWSLPKPNFTSCTP